VFTADNKVGWIDWGELGVNVFKDLETREFFLVVPGSYTSDENNYKTSCAN